MEADSWLAAGCFVLPKRDHVGERYQNHYEVTKDVALLGTNISPFKGTFEDDFPFIKVGYVIVPWRVCSYKRCCKIAKDGIGKPILNCCFLGVWSNFLLRLRLAKKSIRFVCFFYKICILPTKVQEDLELKTMWNKPWWLVNLPMVFKPFKPLTRTNFFGCLCVTLQGGGRLTSHENNGLGWCTQLFLSLRCGLNKWFCTVTATGRWEDNTTCVPQNPVFTECQYVLLNLRWYMTIRSFKGHMFSIAAHLNWLRSLEDQRCSTGNS